MIDRMRDLVWAVLLVIGGGAGWWMAASPPEVSVQRRPMVDPCGLREERAVVRGYAFEVELLRAEQAEGW